MLNVDQGGTMGFYCGHHYAHTMKAQSRRLPYALKGCDAIFYSVFRHLGYDLGLRPILQWDQWLDEDMDGAIERAIEQANSTGSSQGSDTEDRNSSRGGVDFVEARNSSRVGVDLPELDINSDLEIDNRLEEDDNVSAESM